MTLHAFIALVVAVVGTVLMSSFGFAEAAPADGLMAVRSWNLDEVSVRPNVDLASYRKVLIDAPQIAFRNDWNRSEQDYRGKTRRLVSDDVRSIADDMTSVMQSSITEAFKARGYEIVRSPGPGVLRLTPTAAEVYVNAGDETPPGATKLFTKDAGEATLVLEVRDSLSGELLARVVDHRIARETKGTQLRDLRRTTNVSNAFWFDEAFRRWANDCAKELGSTKQS